jgi:hypothetical protein
MLVRSSKTTVIHLTFNETDIDRLMPAEAEATGDMADNESVDVGVPEISLPRKETDKSDTSRLGVVDARALV